MLGRVRWRASRIRRAAATYFPLKLCRKTKKVRCMSKPAKNAPKALMLGIGLDSDGHKRVTTGPNFALVGGSKDTHDQMTEKAVKISEKLSRKGKTLETVSPQEFDDIAHEVGLKRHEPQRN
jgi:hypothetical protein